MKKLLTVLFASCSLLATNAQNTEITPAVADSVFSKVLDFLATVS